LQFPGPLFPVGHEPKHVLLRRLGGKRFEPPNGLAPGVGEGMDTSDAGPEHVAGPRVIPRGVHRRVDLAAPDRRRLLVRVIVQPDGDAWQVLDEQQAVMAGAKLLVDEPLQEHAFQAAGLDASLVPRWNLPYVEVAEQVSVGMAEIQTQRIRWCGRTLE